MPFTWGWSLPSDRVEKRGDCSWRASHLSFPLPHSQMPTSSTFRGRKINRSGRYPRVHYPSHPAAMKDGLAYLHRVVAWEAKGPIGKGCHVHHRNGDPEDWCPDNLEVLSPGEHASRHRTRRRPQIRQCGSCGEPVEIRTARRMARPQIYCSHECASRAREVTKWPDDLDLIVRVREKGAGETGRELGVSDSAVRKRVQRLLRSG
jgi:hypothetical protein